MQAPPHLPRHFICPDTSFAPTLHVTPLICICGGDNDAPPRRVSSVVRRVKMRCAALLCPGRCVGAHDVIVATIRSPPRRLESADR
jgi:hypothetical protein